MYKIFQYEIRISDEFVMPIRILKLKNYLFNKNPTIKLPHFTNHIDFKSLNPSNIPAKFVKAGE